MCSICFCEVHPVDNPRGKINSCDHLFCSYCIKEWAKTTNVCPTCKTRFTRIFSIKDDSTEEVTKVRRRNYVAWESNYDDEEDESPTGASPELVICDICREGHSTTRMLLCDHRECYFAAHMECLNLTERPLTFLCPTCADRRGTTQHVSAPPTPAPESPTPLEPTLAPAKRLFKPSAEWMRQLSRNLDSTATAAVVSTPTPVSVSAPTDEDDLYFLAPSRHAREARARFSELKNQRGHEANLRRERGDAKRRRLEAILAHQQTQLPTLVSSPVLVNRRPRSLQQMLQELQTRALQIEEVSISNPALRQATEESMVRTWAEDMLPLLRRDMQIKANVLRLDDKGDVICRPPITSSEITLQEQALWEQAVKMARPLVQQNLAQRVAVIRARRKLLLRSQAQRETAALAKLARIIALNRQQSAVNDTVTRKIP